jgi:hypothetical protein
MFLTCLLIKVSIEVSKVIKTRYLHSVVLEHWDVWNSYKIVDRQKNKNKKKHKKQKKQQQISEWKVDLYIDNLSESDVIKIQIEICFVNRWTFPYNFVFCCTGRGKTYFKDCLVNRREYVTILGLFVSRCELAAEP